MFLGIPYRISGSATEYSQSFISHSQGYALLFILQGMSERQHQQV